MINFKQFLDLLTLNGKYHWFILPVDYLQFLTKEELAQVDIVEISEQDVRVWYPKHSWIESLNKEGLMRAMNAALDKNDFELVKLIKERLKEINENNNKT